VDEHFPNDNDGLTDEHTEGDHLKNFGENFGNWLARTTFETRQKTSLGNKSKEEYFKMAKEILHFPNQLIFSLWQVITRLRWVITCFFFVPGAT
jgi:hypothetical protein